MAHTSMNDLGLAPWLVEACAAVGITKPTAIQRACILPILQGRDVIGSANTGSGKTAAFALPILHHLARDPFGVFALVLTPTRELAFQLAEQFRAFGKAINLKDTVVVGGLDTIAQASALSKRPHVVIATPGRLADHLSTSTDDSIFRHLRFLVLDEADRVLEPTFATDLATILEHIPRKRQTLLFSATMNDGLEHLAHLSMNNPVVHHTAPKYSTVEHLTQQYVFIPSRVKPTYLVYLLRNTFADKTAMIFTSRCRTCELLRVMLRELQIRTVALHSSMSQNDRLAALAKFKSGVVGILLATDVGSRGLDIPLVQLVINYDVPSDPTDYIHRVGRTARAGRGGLALTVVSERDVDLVQTIEGKIGKQLDELELSEREVLKSLNEISAAERTASLYLEEIGFDTKKKVNKRKQITHGEDEHDKQADKVGQGKRAKPSTALPSSTSSISASETKRSLMKR